MSWMHAQTQSGFYLFCTEVLVTCLSFFSRFSFTFPPLTCERKWAAALLYQQWSLFCHKSPIQTKRPLSQKFFNAWDNLLLFNIGGNVLFIPPASYALNSVSFNGLSIHTHRHTQKNKVWISLLATHPSVPLPLYNCMPSALGLVNSTAGTNLCSAVYWKIN